MYFRFAISDLRFVVRLMLPGFRDLEVVSHQSAIDNQKSQMLERYKGDCIGSTAIAVYG